MYLKKNDTSELIYKTETDSQTWNKNLWLPRVGEKLGKSCKNNTIQNK